MPDWIGVQWGDSGARALSPQIKSAAQPEAWQDVLAVGVVMSFGVQIAAYRATGLPGN